MKPGISERIVTFRLSFDTSNTTKVTEAAINAAVVDETNRAVKGEGLRVLSVGQVHKSWSDVGAGPELVVQAVVLLESAS